MVGRGNSTPVSFNQGVAGLRLARPTKAKETVPLLEF